jgi:hypothetical protein
VQIFIGLQTSTISYLGWAGLYFVLEFFRRTGWLVPISFFELLNTDFFINLVSPFVIAGSGLFIGNLSKGWRPQAWVGSLLIASFCAATILIPLSILWKMGGWSVLLSAGLFFSRVNWFRFAAGGDTAGIYLFARGLAGPFLFFAPALLVTSWVFRRETLGPENLDFVPFFGVLYFLMQAAFEEFILRIKRKVQPDGSIVWDKDN